MLLASWVPGALGLLLRGWLYPWLLGACGRNVSFGTNVVLRHPRKIRIGDDVAIDDGCVLDAKGSANHGIDIGSRVFLGRHTILACKEGDIALEDGVNVSYNCVGLLRVVGPDRRGDPPGRLLLRRGRRPRLRPRWTCPSSSRRGPPGASSWARAAGWGPARSCSTA